MYRDNKKLKGIKMYRDNERGGKMKKRGIALFVIMLSMLSIIAVYAGSFQDNSQPDFSGTYNLTFYNSSGFIQLSTGNLSGNYTSRIFDATSIARWDNLTWQGNLTTKEYLYAIDNNADVWNSANFGVNWTLVKDNLNGAGSDARASLFNASGIYFVVFNSNQQIWKSENSGVSWTQATSDYNGDEGQNPDGFAINLNNNLYLIEGDQDVWKSTDFGATWSKINGSDFNKGNGAIAGLVVNSSNTLITVDIASDVWSSNNGIAWNLVKDDYNGATEGNGATALAIDRNNNLYILDSQTVWSSSDSGVTWAKVSSDFDPSDAHNGISLTADSSNNLYLIDGNEDVYKSTNSGATWSKQITNFNAGNGNARALASILKSTNISFQVRNCSLPDCSDGTWQSVNLSSINLTGRYFQYKSYFSSQDISITPKLHNVSIDYIILDSTPPQFSNFTENPANNSEYAPGQAYKFNSTITDNTAVGSAWTEFNGTNYTSTTNISNIYTFTKNDLAVGNYAYKWWANDTNGNINNSVIRYYTVKKADSNVILLSSAGWNYNYGTETIFRCNTDYGSPRLYINNTEFSNPSTLTLAAGSYTIKCNITSSENYTSGTAQNTLIINKIPSQASLTFDKTSPQTYETLITPSCSRIIGEENPAITLNGDIITSGQALSLGAGTWRFNCSIDGSQNYTASGNFSQFIINPDSTITAIIAFPNPPVSYGTASNFSCSNSQNFQTTLYINGENKNNEKGLDVVRAGGDYVINCSSEGNQNYSASSYQETYTINKAEGNIELYLNSQENNLSIEYPEQYNLTARTIYGTITIFQNGEDITSQNGLNQTPAKTSGVYNITAISSGDENHSSISLTRWLNVTLDTDAPLLNLISPQDGGAYGYNSDLPLTFSVSDEHPVSCWYSLNYGENLTLENCQNTTFNINTDGNYYLTLYVNDSLGNEATTTNYFSVQVGSPSIMLNSPIGVYLNAHSATFRYLPGDSDLESCELWGNFDGEFKLNQTDNNPLNYSENTFLLTLPDGAYKWNVRCNDSLGHFAFNGNKTFYVDTTVPQITLTQPRGTQSSRTNIPIEFRLIDSSPVTCWYNIYRGINPEKENTTIENCANTYFNTTIGDADFMINLYARDYAGNLNFSSSSFSVSTSSPSNPPSGGGSPSGGGGGSRTSRIELSSVSSIIMNPGESKKLALNAKNTGTSFLNKCKLIGAGENAGWISAEGTKNIGNGENSEFVFDLEVPGNTSSGSYDLTARLECQEASEDRNISVEIIEKKIEISLLEVKREGNKLRIAYSLSEMSNQEQEVNVEIVGYDRGEKVLESKETKKILADSDNRFEILTDLNENTGNLITIMINANSGVASAFAQEDVIIGGSGFTGFNILSVISNNPWWAALILASAFAVFAFFMIRRIIGLRKMAGLHKVKDVKYVRLSEHGKK